MEVTQGEQHLSYHLFILSRSRMGAKLTEGGEELKTPMKGKCNEGNNRITRIKWRRAEHL